MCISQKLINLSLLPTTFYLSKLVENFIKHNKEIHVDIRRKVEPSNEDYKFQ